MSNLTRIRFFFSSCAVGIESTAADDIVRTNVARIRSLLLGFLY